MGTFIQSRNIFFATCCAQIFFLCSLFETFLLVVSFLLNSFQEMLPCFPLCTQVNILTHTDEIKLKPQRITAIEKKKESLNKKKESGNCQASRTDTDVLTPTPLSESTMVPKPVLDADVEEQEDSKEAVIAEGNLTEPDGQLTNQNNGVHVEVSFFKGKAGDSFINSGGRTVGNGFSCEAKIESANYSEGKFEPTSRPRRKTNMATSKTNNVGKLAISLEPKDDEALLVKENHTEGGALWDIFRREDVSKLHDYLMKHAVEFRHWNYEPVKEVIISACYLTVDMTSLSYVACCLMLIGCSSHT